MVANVLQIYAGRDLTDELPTTICIPKFQFPVNEAMKPELQVFAVSGCATVFIEIVCSHKF
jgi:hypothetical protein